MKKASVNLLKESKQISSKVRRVGILVQTISVVGLVVFGVLVFLLVGYSLFLSNKMSNLDEDIGKEKATISSYSAVEIIHILKKQKLSYLDQIFNENPSYYELLISLQRFSADRVDVNSLSFSSDVAVVNVEASSSDVFSMVSYLADLESFAEDYEIKTIVGNNFMRGQDGTYKYELSFNL